MPQSTLKFEPLTPSTLKFEPLIGQEPVNNGSHGWLLDNIWNTGARLYETGKGLLMDTPALSIGKGGPANLDMPSQNELLAQLSESLRPKNIVPKFDPTGIVEANVGMAGQIPQDISQGNYGGAAANAAMMALPLLPLLRGGKIAPRPTIVEDIPADVKPAIRGLNSAPQLRALPAQGESSVTGGPRFYQGKLGVADANMQYPIDLADPMKISSPFADSMQTGHLGELPPTIAAEQGLGTIPGQALLNPNFVNFFKSADTALADPLSFQFPPNVGYGLAEQFDTRGQSPIKITPPGEVIPTPMMRENIAPEVKLEQPIGGKIVNPPEKTGVVPPFRAKTLTPEEAALIRPLQIEPLGLDSVPKSEAVKINPNAKAPVAVAKSKNGKVKYELIDGRWQRKVEGEEPILPKPSLEQLIKGEEGTFDPNAITRKIKRALDRAATGPVKFIPNENVSASVGKLLAAIDDAKSLIEPQKDIISAEKAGRVADAAKIPVTDRASYYQRLGQLKGKYETIAPKPIKLKEADLKQLFTAIDQSDLMFFQKLHAMEGLEKLIGGRGPKETLPQAHELAQLDRVFGAGFGKQVAQLHSGGGAAIPWKSLVTEGMNIPRIMRSSMDLSAPFRQGAGLLHRPEYYRAFAEMIKNVGNKEHYQATLESIHNKPLFQPEVILDPKTGEVLRTGKSYAEKVGLKITDMENYTNMEEHFMSKFAEKIPGVGRSERAYLSFLNKLRADTFESLINDATKAGFDPANNLALGKQLAEYVNNATGRGSLGSLEKNAVLLNNTFFSPRLISSRLQMLNPMNYISKDIHPMVRRQYLKSALSIAGMIGTVNGLAYLASKANKDVKSGFVNPNSADLGKVRFGENIRLDPGAGFNQYGVLTSRFGTGKTATTDPKNYGRERNFGATPFGIQNRGSLFWNNEGSGFVQNKLAPVPKMVNDWAYATKYKPFNVPDQVTNLFIPMMIEDTYELIKEDPSLLGIVKRSPLVMLNGLGMGVQTYNQTTMLKDFNELLKSKGVDLGAGMNLNQEVPLK